MGTFRIYRRLQDLTDVDPAALPLEGGVPVYHTAVSSFVVETVGAGGSDFSAGVSSLGNTLGDTGVTGTRLVLAGVGRITLSQSTDAAGGTVTISGGTAAAGAFSAGLSNLGNTDGTSGMTGTQMVFAGGNNVTLSQANDGNGATITISGPNTVAQSVQTQDRFDLTAGGNTAGALALISSGTMTLAGGSNITLSQNGNAISIIGQSGAAETQTAISGIANSQTTYTSGTVNLSGLGAITVRSTTGQAFQLSVAAQSVQPETQTFLGGLAGSNTTYTSGTVSIVGSGDITVSSGTGQRIIIFGSQSVQPETQTFVGGVIASDTTYTSGSVRFTGVGGGVTVSSNTGQRVDISVAAPVAQSVQPGIQNLVASNTTFSSGTVTISGFGDVTVNTAANLIRISAPVQTAESQSIGMSNIGNTSGTTGVASGAQVRFLLAGGNNVTLSQSLNGASGTLTISAASQTVQTQNMVAVTLSGNTSGAQALISSGTLTLAGGNNITVSQAGNAVTISGPNVGGAQTGISGIIASDATYTSGTVQFTGSNMITVKSSAGQRVVIDATQSVQPGIQNLVASDATFSSGTVSISGFGAATVNTAANLIRISVPVQSVQPETQTFIAGVANTETTYSSGTVKLLELGAITVRSTTGNQFQLSVNAQTGTQFSAGISGGNTAGDTGTVAGRVVLAGGANITLSGSTNGASETISIVGGGGGGFSGGVSNVGNSSGDTGITGTRLVLAGGNNMTLSQSTNASGGTVTVSGPNFSAISAVAPLSTSTNGSTISILAPAQLSVGFSTQGNTSGNTGFVTGQLQLVGSNGITLSGSTNAGSQTITISGITQSVESQSFGMSNIGNTSGTTGIASGGQVRFLLAGGNNITLSQSLNGASGTITISAPNAAAQTVQTLGMYAVQNTTGQSSSTTMDARTLSIAGDGDISVGYSAGSLRISSPVQTVESQSIGMSNVGNTSGTTGVASGGQVRFVLAGGNNVTLSQSLNGASGTLTISAFNQTVESQSIGMSNVGNTSGTTGVASGGQVRFVFAGGNNITLSQSLNGASGTITISAPNLGAGAMSVGVSNLGNSAGSTGVTGTRLVLVGSDNITLSQSTNTAGGTVSFIGGGGGGFSAGVSTDGNTGGATGVSGTRMVLVGTNAISLSQTTGAAGNTVSIDAPATSSLVGASGISISTNGSTISVYQTPITSLAPYDESPMVTGLQGQGTLCLAPFRIANQLQMDRVGLALQISNATNSSGSFTLSQWFGLYTKNASSLSLVGSTSISTNFSGSGTQGSYSLYAGPGWQTIPWTTTLPPDDYYAGIILRSTTAAANHSISQLLLSKFTNSAWSGIIGVASATSVQRLLGQGHYSATTSAFPGSIAFTQIIGSGSIALRSPVFHLRSGTV